MFTNKINFIMFFQSKKPETNCDKGKSGEGNLPWSDRWQDILTGSQS